MNLSTLVQLFRYNDWARDRLMPYVLDLTDDQLDRVLATFAEVGRALELIA